MNIRNRQDRLKRFYGDVARAQNDDIIALITGKKILDVGCGYGSLIDQIKRKMPGCDITGIDIDSDSIEAAKSIYGIDVRHASVHDKVFEDGAFDTVILREVVHHLNEDGGLKEALKDIRRICRKELIIFDPNPNWVVRTARKLVAHTDPEAHPDEVSAALEESGFSVRKSMMRDVLAFGLSGGFVGMEFIPNIGFLKRAVMNIDGSLNRILRSLKIQKYLCWRYILYAVKTEERRNSGR